jgi:tRNA threonylcarbamoyladenosine modification (KEOPS) complex  Pcc1 subunit
MQQKYEFNLSIDGDTRLIELLYNNLIIETEKSYASRCGIEIWREKGSFKLNIASNDIVSLRANINTWLRLIKVVEDIYKIVKGGDLN